jgi:hypothetical protein
VTTTTASINGGYAHPNARSQRRSPSTAKVAPAISAKATCPDGMAANGLWTSCAEPASSRPQTPLSVSATPAPGTSRGGAVGMSR